MSFQRRFGHDAQVGYTFAAREAEAFGQPPIYYTDGPPNAGAPCVREFVDIDRLRPPRIPDCPGLLSSLAVQRGAQGGGGRDYFHHRTGLVALFPAGNANGLRCLSAPDARG